MKSRTKNVWFKRGPESLARLAIAAMDACKSLDPSFVRGEYLSLRPT